MLFENIIPKLQNQKLLTTDPWDDDEYDAEDKMCRLVFIMLGIIFFVSLQK